MNKKMKRNLMILTVVLFVSAAAYLNWNYSQSAANVGKILGESALVSGTADGSSLAHVAGQGYDCRNDILINVSLQVGTL